MSQHKALDMFGRSGNPALNAETFTREARGSGPRGIQSTASEVMTLQGTVNKTGILLALVVLSASYTWNIFFQTGNSGSVMPIAWGGLIVGVIFFVITMFKVQWAGITAPIYAIAQGLFLGAISAILELQFPGIVIQAVSLTFFVAASLLLAYKTGIIKPTQNFVLMIFAATLGIFLTYLSSFIFSLFTGSSFSIFTDTGWMGIGISLFVVAIAALNLVLDFDIIEQADEQGAPKYMEWFGAMALMATLIWLYIEILRLLMKLRSR